MLTSYVDRRVLSRSGSRCKSRAETDDVFVLRQASEVRRAHERAVDGFDDGYRVEIVRQRELFLFEIDRDSCSVTYSGIVYRLAHEPASIRLESMWKPRSNVSILAVYDTYGLDVALLFLCYLVKRIECRQNPEWLQAYLEACLGVIRGDLMGCALVCSPGMARGLASEIEWELRTLDKMQPRGLGELDVAVMNQLPLELLARIINSTRVSKAIRIAVLALRHGR